MKFEKISVKIIKFGTLNKEKCEKHDKSGALKVGNEQKLRYFCAKYIKYISCDAQSSLFGLLHIGLKYGIIYKLDVR